MSATNREKLEAGILEAQRAEKMAKENDHLPEIATARRIMVTILKTPLSESWSRMSDGTQLDLLQMIEYQVAARVGQCEREILYKLSTVL